MSKELDQRVKRSQKALKESLLQLLKSKDIFDISVSDIVKNAGYSRGSFYAHYENKEDFLYAVIEDEVQEFLNIIYDVLKNSHLTDLNCRMDTVVLHLFEHVYEKRELYQIMLEGKLDTHAADDFVDMLSERLLRELDCTSTDEKMNLEMRYYTKMYHYVSMIRFWMKKDFIYSPKYMAEQDAFYSVRPFNEIEVKKKTSSRT